MDSDWTEIKKLKPITYNRAINLQYKLNIDLLAQTLMSEFSQNLQNRGWKFIKVVKSSNLKFSHKDSLVMVIPNKWDDYILFKKL